MGLFPQVAPDQVSCCHAGCVGRRAGSSSRLKSQRPPEASPGSGQVTPNSGLAQRWPAPLIGNPQQHKETARRATSPSTAPHPAAQGELMHIQRRPPLKAFRLAAWRSRGLGGESVFHLTLHTAGFRLAPSTNMQKRPYLYSPGLSLRSLEGPSSFLNSKQREPVGGVCLRGWGAGWQARASWGKGQWV